MGFPLTASTRMYDATPRVADLWRALVERVAVVSGVPLEVLHHPAPAPLTEIWSRSDLGSVFMCGWPLFRSRTAHVPLVAPIPLATDCLDAASYRSHFVVRADSSYRRLEDTFGATIGWTATHSHSGFNAPRHHLLQYRDENRQRLYAKSIGPLVTPRRTIESVLERRVDVAPVDSYFLDLLLSHEPSTAEQLRSVAATRCTPIPPLVASTTISTYATSRIREAWCAVAEAEENAGIMNALRLRGFLRLNGTNDYAITAQWDEEARLAGYEAPK